MTGPLMTTADLARYAHVSLSTAKRWVAEGRLDVIRIGGVARISPQAADEFLRQHTAPAVRPGR